MFQMTSRPSISSRGDPEGGVESRKEGLLWGDEKGKRVRGAAGEGSNILCWLRRRGGGSACFGAVYLGRSALLAGCVYVANPNISNWAVSECGPRRCNQRNNTKWSRRLRTRKRPIIRSIFVDYEVSQRVQLLARHAESGGIGF